MSKSKKKTQKILIPKGTIDPNQDTLIEIPMQLKEQPLVVAKKRGDDNKSIILETSPKHLELSDDRHVILAQDRSIEKGVEESSKEFSPRHQSSLIKYTLDNESSFPSATVDESSTKDNEAIQMKFDEMQKAKKELQESAFLATSHLSMDEHNTSSKGINDTYSSKPKSNTISMSCSNKSLQSKSSKPQNSVSFKSSRSKCDPDTKVLFQSCSSTPEAPPPFTSTKLENVNASNPHRSTGTRTNTTLLDSDLDTKFLSLMEDEYISADGIEDVSPKSSSKKAKEDKIFQTNWSTFNEIIQSSPSVSLTKKSKQDCKTCSKVSSKASMAKTDLENDDPKKNQAINKLSQSCKKCDKVSSGNSWTKTESEKDYLRKSQEKLKKMYKCPDNDIDDLYIEQLKRQFEEAKRKLEDAVMLASMSLKHLNSRNYSAGLGQKPITSTANRAASICDSLPERDISFVPSCGSKSSCVYVSGPSRNPCSVLTPEASWSATNSDSYKNNEIFKNLSGIRRYTDKERPFSRVPFDQATNSSCQSNKVSKDISTQTEPSEPRIYPNKSKASSSKDCTARPQKLQSSSSKCSGVCTIVKSIKSSSTRFIKEPVPRCNFCDSESLVGKTSTFMS